MTASRSLNSPLSLPKAAISVGQTKVKSFGQKNTTFHLPASLLPEISLKADLGSVLTTALRSKEGNLSPMVSMKRSVKGPVDWNVSKYAASASKCKSFAELFQGGNYPLFFNVLRFRFAVSSPYFMPSSLIPSGSRKNTA